MNHQEIFFKTKLVFLKVILRKIFLHNVLVKGKFLKILYFLLYKNHKNWNWNLTVLYFFENFQSPFFILTYVMIRNFTVLSLKVGGTCTLAPTKNNLKDFVLYVYFFVIKLTSFRVKLKLSVVMP